MINDSALPLAIELANQLRDNTKLGLKHGSPLEELVRYSYPTQLGSEYNGNQPDNADIYQIPECSRTKNQQGVVMHDVATTEVISKVGSIIADNLRTARAVVNPMILSAVDTVTTEMDRIQMGKTNPYTILPDHFSDVWNNPILVSLIEPYKDVPNYDIRSISGLPGFNDVNVDDLLATGIARFDEDLAKVPTNHNPSWLNQVYQLGIVEASNQDAQFDTENNISSLVDMMAKPYFNRDEILAVFIMTKQLLADVPNGTRGDLAHIKEMLAAIMSETGRVLNHILSRRERIMRNRELIIGYPSVGNDYLQYYNKELIIEVNGDVYNMWLKEGGSPEALFGSAASTREKSYTALLENAEGFVERWNRESRVINTRIRMQKNVNLLEALKISISREINKLEEDALPAPREILHGLLDKEIKMLKDKDLENVYFAARQLICRSIFPNTESEKILCAIDKAMTDNPDIQPREAASMATIELVTDWLCEWITIQ